MIRDHISDEWKVVSWDEAITFTAKRFRDIQAQHGLGAIGGISSSRCTNEEVYVVQKMVRAAFHNNNIDTCARVCHSPTGYGLKQTFGTSAGTQDFKSVAKADVIVVIGANPTDAHPVFAARMKRRLREGAKLIVVDPREHRSGQRSPHIQAAHHLQLKPGTNVAVVNGAGACDRDRGAGERNVRRGALRSRFRSRIGARSSRSPSSSPEATEAVQWRAG
jgi:formate dehydrogenase major subunit